MIEVSNRRGMIRVYSAFHVGDLEYFESLFDYFAYEFYLFDSVTEAKVDLDKPSHLSINVSIKEY
jgi:hypothetical protein